MKNSFRITTYFFALALSISLGFVNGNSFDLFTTLIALQTTSVVLFFTTIFPDWVESDKENSNEHGGQENNAEKF
ncbi:hypothetical protein [uncultured Lactococcus sp.]|uniref:hypothetical protein n=1 Tax=uncultured Lactococcus sp. TaxID=167973 RepID=UPI002597C98F|nr:hypothetical protein [uncultured Lactococcus sp.]